jgi:nicotinamidase-related amidase
MHLPASTHPALLVIDVQTGWFLGHPAPHQAAATLQRLNALLDRARAAAVPVFMIQHAEPPDYTLGTPAWELHPDLARAATDRLVGKSVCDAFHDTVLDAELRRGGIETLVIAGCATEFCVDTTIRVAASRGYRVVVASGAHTTKDRPVLTAAQIIAHHEWVWAEMSVPYPIRVGAADALRFD